MLPAAATWSFWSHAPSSLQVLFDPIITFMFMFQNGKKEILTSTGEVMLVRSFYSYKKVLHINFSLRCFCGKPSGGGQFLELLGCV